MGFLIVKKLKNGRKIANIRRIIYPFWGGSVPEQTVNQILDAVRMKGWEDLISQEAISEVSYSPEFK